MQLSDYNLTFLYIKCSNSILADAILRVKTLGIYRDPLDNLNTTVIYDEEECTAEVIANETQTLGNDRHCVELKKNITCRKLAVQLHHKNNK